MLTISILLVLVGIFVLDRGPQILNPITGNLGLAARYQTETPILPQTLLSVAPSNYNNLSASLRSNVPVKGLVEVAGGREIAFYVMNEGNFSQWRMGRPSAVILVKPTTAYYNFTFIPRADATYYFIFDNQDSSRRSVIFSLSELRTATALSPVAQYAGYEILATGIILLLLAVKTGRKLKAIEGPKWICKFCGAKNIGEQTYCEKCGRSQQ